VIIADVSLLAIQRGLTACYNPLQNEVLAAKLLGVAEGQYKVFIKQLVYRQHVTSSKHRTPPRSMTRCCRQVSE
jgi:hypothetical protein